MTYKKDKDGKIIQCTRQAITGSIILPQLKPGCFVLIKNAKKTQIPYGIYGGMMDTMVLVRTYQYDALVEPKNVVPIVPSESIIDEIVAKMQNLQELHLESKFYKLYMAYLYWKYPTKITGIIHKCAECGEMFPSIELKNGKRICAKCYHKLYATCSHCNQIYKKIDMVGKRCKECAKYQYITPYHTDTPKIVFYGENTPYMGIELEVDAGGESDRVVKQIMQRFNGNNDILIYCSADATITNGFEIISQPMGIGYHTEIYNKYKTLFEYLQRNGYEADNAVNCGLHIHVDRSYFGNKTPILHNILYLHEKLYNDIMVFSRRNMDYLDSCKKFPKPVKHIIKCANMDRTMRRQCHKYYIDITGKETIEFRYFQSTLNINYLFAALQLVHNIVNYCMRHTNKDIDKMLFEDLLTTDTLRNYWKEVTGNAN